jgi:hypothetical protein
MKVTIIIALILLAAVIVCGCLMKGGFGLMSNPIKNIEIDKAIELEKSDKYKNMLINFKKTFSAEDFIIVTSYSDHFEIIVSHPDTVDYTGGAEQYYLDKKTGNSKMGWHESPRPI